MKSFMRINQVMAQVGFAKSKLWKMVKNGEFPQPIKLTQGTTVWIDEEVNQWIEEQITKHRGQEPLPDEPTKVKYAPRRTSKVVRNADR